MHICFVCREYPPSLRGGGIASYIKEISHGLHEAGHEVTVICASDDTRKEEQYDDDEVHVIRLKGGDFIIPQAERATLLKKFRMFYRFFSYRKRILHVVRRLKDVDIIEVPEYGAEGYYLHRLSIPVVMRLHTPMLLDHEHFSMQRLKRGSLPYYWQGRKELDLIRKAKHITSCSTSLKQWVYKYLCVPEERMGVIYNPIRTKDGSQCRWQWQPHGVKQILFAGTICDWKGCGDLAAACRLLHEKGTVKFQLNLVGKTGKYAAELQKKYGKESWFNIVGKVSREKLMKMYATADLVCFPSWWENMPMVCIEAMLCGGIVLGSSSGGMSEIIMDGEDGFLLPPKNPEAWCNKIEKILHMDGEALQGISMQAQAKIEKQFGLDTIVNQTIQYYNKVIFLGKGNDGNI